MQPISAPHRSARTACALTPAVALKRGLPLSLTGEFVNVCPFSCPSNCPSVRRRSYSKLLRTLLYTALYIVILFLQKNPTQSYQVYNTLQDLVFPSQQQQGASEKLTQDAIYDWLGGARTARAHSSNQTTHQAGRPERPALGQRHQ